MSCKENCDPGIKDCAEQIDSLRHWLGVSERRRKIAQDELSALRLRVEALEGAARVVVEDALSRGWDDSDLDGLFALRAALQPGKGKRCGRCGGARMVDCSDRDAQKPCPGCPDCKEVSDDA